MGFRDFLVDQMAAAEDRAAVVQSARDAWITDRAAELLRAFNSRTSTISANHALGGDVVPLTVEFVQWVLDTDRDAAWTLSDAMQVPGFMRALHGKFANERAELEARSLADDFFVEVA